MCEQEQCIVVSARIMRISVVATNYKTINAIMKWKWIKYDGKVQSVGMVQP